MPCSVLENDETVKKITAMIILHSLNYDIVKLNFFTFLS